MSTLFDHYKVLGVSVGASIADITSAYKRLCHMYHPDVSDDPGAEELMKRINIAYTVLREKLKRETILKERQGYSRTTRKNNDTDTHESRTETRKTGAETEKEALSVIQSYFEAIISYNYSSAYEYLSTYDKRRITRESFIEWRKSVARVSPIREFKIDENSTAATVTFNDDKTLYARKFHVIVTEEDYSDETTSSGDVEKLVINENGKWRVFLGYRNVNELTRAFDERFEARRKRDAMKLFEEYYNGLYQDYNMLSMAGMRKAALRELYRQKRFGGSLTLAVISVKISGVRETGQEELRRCAARTIKRALRETDIPAYADDGIFAILFVELKKKNAEYIVDRLAKKIRGGMGPQLGVRAEIDYAFETWSGSGAADIGALDSVLKKFGKKL